MRIENIAFGLASIVFTIAALPAHAAPALLMGGASCSPEESKYYNSATYKWTKSRYGHFENNTTSSDILVTCPVAYDSNIFPAITMVVRVNDQHRTKSVSCTRWFESWQDRFETRTSKAGTSNIYPNSTLGWEDLTFSEGIVNVYSASLSCVVPQVDIDVGRISQIINYTAKQK